MEEQNTDNLIKELSTLSYNDKKRVYDKIFSLGNLVSKDMNDKLVLVSLVSLTYQKLKEKDKTVTPLKVLLKITNQPVDNSVFYQALEVLSILVEDFSYDCTKIDSCGLTTSQEIINKIKTLLNSWIPF